MTLVLLTLTISMGMARRSIVRWLRSALPHITRASGVLLIVAGAYLAHYGWYERQVRSGDLTGSAAVDTVTGWSDDIAGWVNDTGATRLGLLLSLALAAVLRSEEHTSELQSLMRISYAVFCLKKKKQHNRH